LESTKSTNTIKSIRTLDVSTLANTINIEPVGVPTGKIITNSIQFLPSRNPDLKLIRLSGKETSYRDRCVPIPGVSTNIYYVFKSKPTKLSDSMDSIAEQVLPNYVLVPVLNIAGLGIGQRGRSIKTGLPGGQNI